jgi:hypothetical protein
MCTRDTTRQLLVCMIFTGLLCAKERLLGEGYSVDGQLEVVVNNLNEAGTTNRHAFRVEVINGRYKIKVSSWGDNTNYNEYSYEDGTMFILHHLTRSKRLDSGPNNSRSLMEPKSLYPAKVVDRQCPPNDGSRAQFIWFAYASSEFFKNVTNDMTLPIWDPEDPKTGRQPFEMQTKFELSRAAPGLPASVTFINDGFYKSYNPATKSVDVIPLNPPYDKGFTKAVYRVTAMTNTPHSEVPSSFVFTVYLTPIGRVDIFERIVVRGTTTRCADLQYHNGQGQPLRVLQVSQTFG